MDPLIYSQGLLAGKKYFLTYIREVFISEIEFFTSPPRSQRTPRRNPVKGNSFTFCPPLA
jgi:hypothetical protein